MLLCELGRWGLLKILSRIVYPSSGREAALMFVGMDVHRNRTQVCVLDSSGVELENRNVPNDRRVLAEVLSPVGEGTPVAFEPAYGTGWIAEVLRDLGLEPHLAHAAGCRAIADAKLKYDRLDARTLANLVRTGYLAEAWLAPSQVRDARLLLRERAWLVRARTAAKNRIRAQLADEGIPVRVALWTKAGSSWLEHVELSKMHRWVVTDCQTLVDTLEERIRALESEIRRQAKPDERVSALMAIPGIGLLSAMTLVAEIGDITRFPTSRKLCAWAGLTPAMRNSDRKIRHGHITKAGPQAVRHVLGEAAQVAIRSEPHRSDFAATKRRRGTGIALVRVARKLLTEAFWVLRQLDDASTSS
jgi:transposase